MTDKPDLGPPALKDNAVDLAAGFASSVPFVGPLIATVIKDTIPNVRLERIETYIRFLQDRIDELQLETALKTPEGLDTFEEGMWQSARAVSEDRKDRIASLVAVGLTSEDFERQQCRHCLQLMSQLADEEVALLAHIWKNPPNFTGPGDPDIMSGDPTQQERDEANLSILRKKHLASFGLLNKFLDENEYMISPAGGMFLRFIGIASKEPPNIKIQRRR